MSTPNTNAPAARMSFSLYARLSIMFFLQYAIWGAWLPMLWSFLIRLSPFYAQRNR